VDAGERPRPQSGRSDRTAHRDQTHRGDRAAGGAASAAAPEGERAPIEIPPPEVTIDIPVDPQTTAISDVTTKPVPKAPPAPPAPRNVVKPKGKFPSTDDFYPAASIRLEEQGSVVVRTCVGPNNKLSETPTVTTSSGSARLDEAAVKLAKAARFTAGSVDGTPNTDCFSTRVRFELKK
jgi:TonB family protein